MNTIYIVELVPSKRSKDRYFLGAYTSDELAMQAGRAAINSPDTSWWINFRITKMSVNK